MNQLKTISPILFVSIISFFLLVACGGSKKVTKTNEKETPNLFVKGAKIDKEESYAHIVNSVARLRSMMCGMFVHYNTSQDPEKKKYATWLVNDNKDSVVVYTLPVGDPNKIGYWIYTYQIMTSLPDEPIYESFSKLTELNRDTIKAVFYAAPDGFDVPLDELLKDPKAAFSQVDVETLELHKDDSDLYYVKQKPTHYIAESVLSPVEKEVNKVSFTTDFQDINPRRISFGRYAYDKDKKKLGRFPPEHLLKEAMLRSDFEAIKK